MNLDLSQSLEGIQRTNDLIDRLAKGTSEHSAQVALFAWAALMAATKEHPELALMFAIPNGGKRGDGTDTGAKISGGRLKAEGVKAGVPDIFLPVARHGVHGLFIEMKRPKSNAKRSGTVRNDQSEWIVNLQANGYGACACYSFLEAKEVIERYLSP